MRPDCSWSMSTAGLAAQEICLPTESPFLRGSQCHSMAGSKSAWKYHHDLDNLYFSIDTSMGYNLQSQQQVPSFLGIDKNRPQPHTPHSPGAQRLPPKKSRPSQLSLPFGADSLNSSPVEDDQVVPCFQRLSMSDRSSPPHTPSRVAKPLPPIPGSIDLSSDQTVDHEVEFFTGDDSRCLVSELCPKSFRYGAPSRRSFRDCGQINYAFFDGPSSQLRQQQLQKMEQKELRDQPQHQQREQEVHEQQQQVVCLRQQDRAQRKLRRSHSGPAGSFNKPTFLRLACHHKNSQGPDKPEVPPRVPIPPRPAKTADYRRWSAEVSSGGYSDEDRPPKIPPREPLPSGSSRTPSPKSLPTYLNGIMPPTQSFAPDPKYVSRGLQRQNSEGSPCILPVMENGRKACSTHYFLLPQRPAYLDKYEKYLMDNMTKSANEAPGTDCDCPSKRKAHLDLV